MPRPSEVTIPATRRTRRSIGAHADVHKALDKENATTDVSSTLADARKKSRSKSLGPGGLDALKQASGNRRASLAAPSKPPRSILKPPISALAEIPPLKKRPSASSDTTVSSKPRSSASSSAGDLTSSKIAVRTEEEQQAAAREREERERRDARRKSLANRRVSFAAEATLHTFHEIDYMQDSTTSTDSSRRASSAAGSAGEPTSQNHTASASPAKQDQSQQMKRRISGVQPLNFHNPDDDTATSTIYSSDSEPADAVEEIAADEDEGSSSGSDDGTMVSIETEEITSTSMGSNDSVVSAEDSSTLDEALRAAAQRADTQRHAADDSDDGEEIIPSFGWVKKNRQQNIAAQDKENIPFDQGHRQGGQEEATVTDMDMDMDMTTTVGRIVNATHADESVPDEDMSMDVTMAYGGILPQNQAQHVTKSGRRADSPVEDEEATMELTTAVGGIQYAAHGGSDDAAADEEMSMEMTTILGGVLSKQKEAHNRDGRRQTLQSDSGSAHDDTTMDMTVGLGQIISAAQKNNSRDDDLTAGMDMTTTLGGIINNGAASPRTLGKKIMVEEADKPNNPEAAVLSAIKQATYPRRRSTRSSTSGTTAEGSPSLSAFQGKGLRRSVGPQPSTPDSRTKLRGLSPSARSEPPPKMSLASPKRSPSGRTKGTPSPKKPVSARNSVFQDDPKTGSRTPTVILTPQGRKVTGIGADRIGIGSPKITALCDRRGSIGDVATDFVLGKRTVAFQDPQEMAQQVEKERQDEEDRENRRRILEREADGSQDDKDSTLNLREMIDSMSPRKPLKGRKSLHVGSASGILGKRPMELDDDEEAEENDGVKRLKGLPSSPVKGVRLQHPPTKAETTGRLSRSSRLIGRDGTPATSSPFKNDPVTTPKDQGRYKNVTDDVSVHEVNFEGSPVKDAAQLEDEADEGRIHLQDFLNMTSIRFMELNTTKRRPTIAPGTLQDGTNADGEDVLSLQKCVVAGACTIPMLELYQHSCRELKKYISEGRSMVREIEAETFEDNPPLFREYMAATQDVKALMDHQFKNVKTHARLLSKAMWYEWRMKLQEGLKEGLTRISEGMQTDDKLLQSQHDLLSSVVPALKESFESITEECSNLEEAAQELADCDPVQLETARDELITVTGDIAEKKKQIAALRQQLEEAEAETEELNAQKQASLTDIKDSEKIRADCRGWTSIEVNALKDRVDAIESKHGWAVTGISGTNLSMTYRRDVELVFDIASFQPHQPNSRIDLWYIGDTRDSSPTPKTAEKEFFLQCIRDRVRALPQSRTQVSQLLEIVQAAWEKALLVSSRIDDIKRTFPTTVVKTSDSSISLTNSLLLAPLETRVEVILNLHSRAEADGVGVAISPEAKVVYGEQFNAGKMKDFLATHIGESVAVDGKEWSDVMVELHERLIARGRK